MIEQISNGSTYKITHLKISAFQGEKNVTITSISSINPFKNITYWFGNFL